MTAASHTRIGIIGTGNIGTAYALAIESSATVTLAAVCDSHAEQREPLESTTGAAGFANHADLLQAGICDAVIVATPPATHPNIVIDCLEAGVDVLCEKPFAIDVASARSMFEIARRSGRLLAMASKFRYVADIARAADLIRSGAIGEPTLIDVTFASMVDMSDRWNSISSVSGGGVLIDNGTHAVDIVRFLVGPIRRVSAVRGRTGQADGVEDTATLLASTTCAAIATIHVSWSMPAHKRSFVVVNGTKGVIKIGWTESLQRQNGGGEWTHFGDGYSKMEALRANVENFAAAASGHEQMRISDDDVMASVSVIEAAYDAIRTGRWIDIEDTQPDPRYKVGVASRAG